MKPTWYTYVIMLHSEARNVSDYLGPCQMLKKWFEVGPKDPENEEFEHKME